MTGVRGQPATKTPIEDVPTCLAATSCKSLPGEAEPILVIAALIVSMALAHAR
jgi:hypothetical protein